MDAVFESRRNPRSKDRRQRALPTRRYIRNRTGAEAGQREARRHFDCGSGTPAALPQKTLKERGYAGKIYQTHGVANNDFLRVCGKDCEGTYLPAGPVLVTEQLPNDHPVKKSATAYVTAYEGAQGKGSVSTFGAHAWDVGVLLQTAIPVALKKGQPGTKEFRAALRDALEGVKNAAGAHGIFNMSANDHLGLDQRAAVMIQIKDGKWVMQK